MKCKAFVMKVGKRNLAIVLSVLVIGGAIAGNYFLFRNAGEKGVMYYQGQAEKAAGGEETPAEEPTSAGGYYASTQIQRERDRAEEIEVLNLIVANEDAPEENVQSALAQIGRIAAGIEMESNIETMVKAKLAAECIAVISEDKCSVILSKEGLLPSEIAQVQEIVYEQSGILPQNVKLVEKAG